MANDKKITVDQLENMARMVDDKFIDEEELKKSQKEVSDSEPGLMSASDKSKIDRMPSTVKVGGVLSGSGWVGQEDGTFAQTITVGGVTSSNDILVTADNAYLKTYMSMGCRCVGQAENSLTFECTEPSTMDIPVGVIIYDFNAAEHTEPSIVLSSGVLKIK